MDWSWFGFVAGLLVGWLFQWALDVLFWRRRHSLTEKNVLAKNDELSSKLSELTAQLESATEEQLRLSQELARRIDQEVSALDMVKQAQGEIKDLKAQLAEAAAAAETSAGAIDPQLEPDDLEKIEGIGPKIASILNEASIFTFDQLAKTTVEEIGKLLEAAGPRFQLAEPDSWSRQSALAAAGKWDELEVLQESLKGGR